MIGNTNSIIQIISGLPIEISDETELSAELSNIDNIGKIYRYTGFTTDTYTQDCLYMCTDDSEVIY